MKSWNGPHSPVFKKHKNGVAMTAGTVTYFIPWPMWEWIKMAMSNDQFEGPTLAAWDDPPSDDTLHDSLSRLEEASSEEVEGRHEGVQSRRSMRSGTMQERRDGIEMGSGIIERNRPYLRALRNEGRADHGDEADCPHAGGGSGPDNCDCR
jgi:hypothetical protein